MDEVFTRVYAGNEWGGEAGEFCSGIGSEERFAAPYVETLRAFFEREAERTGRRIRVVDLGCGDFRVGQRLIGEHIDYLGVDIVENLIDHNRQAFAGEHVDFLRLDIVAEPLPNGDVCLLRQVLQHLSNAQILVVLEKLHQYRHAFVTEHHPEETQECVPNIDKPHGWDIRLGLNSGVFLDQPPFNVPNLVEVLSVPHDDWGLLRTFQIDCQGSPPE